MRHLVFLILLFACARVLWAELRHPPQEIGRVTFCNFGVMGETIYSGDRLRVTAEHNWHQIAVGGDQRRVRIEARVDYQNPVAWTVDVDAWPDHYAGRHAGHWFTGFETPEGSTRIEEWTLEGAIGPRWTRCLEVEVGERPCVKETRVRGDAEPSLRREPLVTLPFRVDSIAADLGGRYLMVVARESGGLFVLDLPTAILRPVPLPGRLALFREEAHSISRAREDWDTFVLSGDLTHVVELRDRGGDGHFERVRIVDWMKEPSWVEQLLALL